VKIALVSNFWYRRGGLERVMLADAGELEARGHQVGAFASAHALNEPSRFSPLFPLSVDHGALGRDQRILERAATGARLFHNPAAVRAFDQFVEEFRPQVVHQHGLSRQLSASVLERAHALRIPTVLTLHDYSLRCPAGSLSRRDAPVCIDVSCAGHRYDRAVRFRCVHGSGVASALAATELLSARAFRRYQRSVDLFLVPSRYVRERMVESGLPASRLSVLANAIEPRDGPAPALGTSVLAYGRLVKDKGFDLVIAAARHLPGIQFVIAGDGPERPNLERLSSELRNVAFAGLVNEQRLAELLADALIVVVPSRWPEPFGMVVLEAWRDCRPVVATRRGALAEIVEDGATGLIVDAEDPLALVHAIERLVAEPDLARALGDRGRLEADTTYAMSAHVDALEATYQGLLT
jgi:glycosyltransferase involved in cell wall biosynthesis